MSPWLRRHQRPATLATAGVCALIMVIWGMAELTAPFGGTSSSSCSAHKKPATLKRTAVTVSIYNAGAPPGSAAKVARSLKDLGFKIAIVGNAPGGMTVTSPEVVGTSTTDPAAELVAAAFGTPVVSDPALLVGTGVNVYIGSTNSALVASAPAEISLNESTSGSTTC